MKRIRAQLTYANVMSSVAVFLALGGAVAVAADSLPSNSVGPRQLQSRAVKTGYIDRNAVRVGKIGLEAVRAGKLAKNAVPTNRIRNKAVATAKIADDAVTGDKVKESTLGTVPDASKLGGHGPDAFVGRGTLLWALVNENGALVAGSGVTSAARLGTGEFTVAFNHAVDGCATEATATDVSGGEAPSGGDARIVGTDNRIQVNASVVDVSATDPSGVLADPAAGDGLAVTVYC